MSKLVLHLCAVCFLAVVFAQNDGRYRPPATTTLRPRYTPTGRYNPNVNDGRYRPANDGRYVPDGSGRYSGDNGKYVPSDAGKYSGGGGQYVHVDNPYEHDDNPYVGQNGVYKPDRNKGQGTGGIGRGAGGLGRGIVGLGRGTGSLGRGTGGLGRGTGGLGRGIGGLGSGTSGLGRGSNGRGNTLSGQGTAAEQFADLPKGTGTAEGRNGFKILYLFDKEEKDGYHYIFETENGILAEEKGRIEQLPVGAGLRSKGYFEYTGDDGLLYRVDYVADDAGFVPQGLHLPKTPAHVIKLLKYLEDHAKK